ncbi:MAG: MotA/TolQ/ExbB proton channel family protein [Deltaproteobacteria bacterium]|nr:MotA/TolQ/ExbB proton channel family protein [Deltaproteobacteria bacterium]
MESLAAFFKDGGLFMYIILFVLAVGIAITVERVIHLVFKYSINSEELWARIKKAVLENDVAKARAFCSSSTAPVARLFERALASHGKGEREIQNAVDEVSMELIPLVEKRVSYLAMVANVATLLGLLGTIQGLVQAFQAVGNADPSQKATLLASGISIALYTTALGLIVAIPMLVAYSILQTRSNKLNDEIDAYSVKIINLLIKQHSERRSGARDSGQEAQS